MFLVLATLNSVPHTHCEAVASGYAFHSRWSKVIIRLCSRIRSASVFPVFTLPSTGFSVVAALLSPAVRAAAVLLPPPSSSRGLVRAPFSASFACLPCFRLSRPAVSLLSWCAPCTLVLLQLVLLLSMLLLLLSSCSLSSCTCARFARGTSPRSLLPSLASPCCVSSASAVLAAMLLSFCCCLSHLACVLAAQLASASGRCPVPSASSSVLCAPSPVRPSCHTVAARCSSVIAALSPLCVSHAAAASLLPLPLPSRCLRSRPRPLCSRAVCAVLARLRYMYILYRAWSLCSCV